MTVERARQLIEVQVGFGSGYNRHATKLILAEIEKQHGSNTVNQLIAEFNLAEIFDFKPGMKFHR